MPYYPPAGLWFFDLGFALAPIFWVLQLALIIHAYRTGRPYWWIAVLFAFPGVGALAYLAFEILPGLRLREGRDFWESFKPRKWRIRDLRAHVEESDTVNNRLVLAAELFADGQAQEAHDVAAETIQGAFGKDAHTRVAVARYTIELGRHEEALALLNDTQPGNDRILAMEVELLKGYCLLGLKRPAEAEAFFTRIQARYLGEAARYGLACALADMGKKAEAVELWEAIRAKYRKAGPTWRRMEKKWYKAAGVKVKATK
jgi:hypothetical protein